MHLDFIVKNLYNLILVTLSIIQSLKEGVFPESKNILNLLQVV